MAIKIRGTNEVKKIKVLVIIPAFNEESSIENVIKKLNDTGMEVDYLVVNDASKDDTKIVLNNISANYVDLPINLGIGGGVQCGYLYAEQNDYDIAIQMDGDGQHDPTYLNKLIEILVAGEADCVIGSRFITNEGFQSSFLRRVGINFLSKLIEICTGTRIYDVTSGFRAVNRKCICLFAENYAQDYPEPEAIVMLAGLGARIKEVPVIMHERMGGESSIQSFKTVYYMIKVSLSIIVTKFQTNYKRKNGFKWSE